MTAASTRTAVHGRKRRQRPAKWHSLLAADQRLSNALFLRGTGIPRPFWKVLELSGDGLVWLAVALWRGLLPTAGATNRQAWAAFLLCWALDLLLVGALKTILRRARPTYNLQADFSVVVAVDMFSFPSGHASRASFIALLAFIYMRGTHPWRCMAVAAWAVAVALSRAVMGRHYLTDVLAGMLLGLVTVGIATKGQFRASSLLLSEARVEAAYRHLLQYVAQLF